MSLYPVNLNITDKLCLVVGGGVVALRKTKSLLVCDARIRIISPEITPELDAIIKKNEIEWFERGFAEGDLRGAFLVFAATDNPDVQLLVAREAAKNAVLLNSADDPLHSHFHVPAHFRRGKMLVTVSTEGSSPALAKKIRQQMEKEIVPEYAIVVELLALIREKIIGLDDDSDSNSELFRRLLQQGIVELVLNGNWFELQMMLLRELPAEADAVELMKKIVEE
ncbi:bifunctional precorrin-2 dehydrogenase/sirohydrochlorin ferrochelatase [Desulfopila sp. IMCC35006]|uniref:precorrin-2 dehydrogenase/sirohydrochlorin ferrochelatase family protein n=1 Tax=Desulfopila sp. IMCC35006 TaxID=2569542 RepID=UPI0010ACA371|nr:bifunctional precorrin-2 dehydrogenase/sirohydrochlorin ferrochelatase [Desulfopila sp. IMCC35006]TKB28471.1 bifunctional precorrin-2 dehydrogenase/sirohydrochlorin ferrochelatase [Desulfopila sp. IMCC35006]